jgi:parallel beta-helix repeat protein
MKTTRLIPGRSVLPIFLLFCSVFCFAQTGFSTTYYISLSGNDLTGTGTAINPWRTLYKATSVVAGAGDIIHVNTGTFTETLQCALKPGVSIEGDGASLSIIKSTLTAAFTPILSAQSAEGTNGNQHISNLKFDGNNLATSWAIAISGRKNMSIYNCTFINFNETGVNWAGRNDGVQAPPTTFATGNSFHDNIMTNCATADNIYGRGCLQFGGQDGMLIYNNVITNNSRAAGTNGWPLKGCNDSYIKNCKIYNNTLTSAPFPYSANGENGYWDFAIEIFDNLGGNEIYGNNMTGGLDINRQQKGSAAFSVWIHDNTIGFPTMQAHPQSGIILEYSTQTAIIENNIIRNVADGIVFSTRSGSAITNTVIQKNLMYGIGVPGGGYGAAIGFFTDGSNNYTVNSMSIYNNTMNASPGNAPFWGIQLSSASNINLLSFKNNIVTGFNIGGAAMVSNVLGNITNSQFQYNNFYNNSNSDDPFPAWASGTTLAASSTLGSNIKSNPLFVSTTDFHLLPSSPSVDAGTYVGLPYAGTAPDRGYAEAGVILPVKLIDFAVVESKSNNLLSWKTALESNSDYFSVERSINGQDFIAIGRVTAAGFSSTERSYNFTDANPFAGINYYRLVMVDKDASKDLSNTLSINNKKDQSLSIIAAQISSGNRLATITVSNGQNQTALLSLYDGNGRLFLNEKIQLLKGTTNITKNTQLLTKGIYYARISTGEATAVKNILSKE